MILIEDINVPELEVYKSLKENRLRADNSFIADSPKVVNVLLEESDIKVKSILATKEYYDEFAELVASKNIPTLYLADKMQMQKIVEHKIHHNCMMHGIRPKDYELEELEDKILMFDNISSSENVGSMARSMAALGVNSYLLGQSAPHPFSRRVLRVSMGYASRLKIHVYEDIKKTLKDLKSRGYKIFAAEIKEHSTPLQQIGVESQISSS